VGNFSLHQAGYREDERAKKKPDDDEEDPEIEFERIEATLFSHGVKPWELPKYTYREVLLTMWGATQNQEGIRRAAFLIHCSLVAKKDRVKISEVWPLPFDTETNVHLSTIERLKKRQEELKKQNANS
jgi:membrane protein insertase Oxa1/YidC/SpoIIIJ